MTRRAAIALPALAIGALAAAPASAHHGPPPPPEPALLARAILPADATAPAPFPGAPNTEPAPAPGSVQPVGGFSALLDAPGFANYWAMPDNGFGSKANSHSFLLRVYNVHADFETARGGEGGSGVVKILKAITLRDPDHKVPFKIVNDATPDRLLTGGDFDIESFREDYRGTLWFGEEFGPFLLHTDATGKVLEAPIPLPDVKSPDYPPDYPSPVAGAANLASSNGFEGMAISPDGRTLYPTLEGPVTGDDPLTRRICTSSTSPAAATRPRGAPTTWTTRPSWSPTSRRSIVTASWLSSATTPWAPRPCTSRASSSTCAGPTPPARWSSARS
jgi:hypothetical protein